jgi:hypothetical protein
MSKEFLVEALLFLRGEARAQATTTQRRRSQAEPPTLENSRRLEQLASHHLEPLPSPHPKDQDEGKKEKKGSKKKPTKCSRSKPLTIESESRLSGVAMISESQQMLSDCDECTPFFIAAQQGNADIVEQLINTRCKILLLCDLLSFKSFYGPSY